MSPSFDFPRASDLLRRVEASFRSRNRNQNSIARQEIAGYLAKQLEEQSRPKGLDEIWKAIRGTKLPANQAAKLRTAVADVGERLDELQVSDSPDATRLELRTNGALEFAPARAAPRVIPEKLLTLLDRRREQRFEELVLDLVPNGFQRPQLESDHWSTVLGLEDDPELEQLLESAEYREYGKRAANSVLGQTLIIAAALYSTMSPDQPILASATHGDQPPRMWLDDDPFGCALRFVYGSLRLHVKRVVFIEESVLRRDRRNLVNYLSLLRGKGVHQRIAPMKSRATRDFLVLPGYRLFEYPAGGRSEGSYPYSHNSVWGDSRPVNVASAVEEWNEMWARASDLDDQNTSIEILLDRLELAYNVSATP